jgi:hypothetical protein
VLVSSALLTTLHAKPNNDYQSATVVSVESNPAAADNATSDAPLRADTYSYNVGIRLGDVVYQATYDSLFASPAFAANQPVQVDLKHNLMYVTLPGNRTIPMSIETRTGAGQN